MESADTLMEEQKLMAEAKYRQYMTNIDKALRNFEYSSEWADLIAALGKLSKAISSNTQYQVIPRRLKIAKRLAQCMHPALPSGVHLKALETYSVIFSKTGPERLATEFIYGAGLFPLLGYAAMNVRPALLNIYETYFVPLGDRLRPALSGFLSGVLPGYDCGLDHFERISALLKKVCEAVNPMHFYTVLWESVANNAAIRLPAITFLLEHFNKRLDMQKQIYIMGHNREIMMSALCACLNDSLILVQRNTLEFLLLGFPMHTKLLDEEQLVLLVTNGLNTILRRDMSLNRRLFSWLLASEITKNSPTYDTLSLDSATIDAQKEVEPYFVTHSRHILIRALVSTLRLSLECQPMDLKPYRIMLSLLDKAEIGSAVLDFVLHDIIRTMYISSSNADALKSANLLFATFDPAYIWSYITDMFERACQQAPSTASSAQSNGDNKFPSIVGSGDPCVLEICVLTEFLLETISLEMYTETTRVYLPKVFLAITQLLSLHMDHLSSDEVTASLKLCMKIVSRVQPMITSPIKLNKLMEQSISGLDEKAANPSNNTSNQVESAAVQSNALEKSKSDSRLNQFGEHSLQGTEANDEELIRRSASNQSVVRHSPKKKAKSFSRLSELDKDISASDTGQQSSSDLDTPRSIKKIKAKAKVPFIRSSPKKNRPKDIVLEPSETIVDAAEEPPKSAPPEHSQEFQLDDEETKATQQRGFSILEKCIRQYEIFFEVYLARQLLQIETGNKCGVKVQLERCSSQVQSASSLFMAEQVLAHECPVRESQIERLFGLLRVDIVARSKQLQRLLNLSLPTVSASEISSDSDASDEPQQKLQIDAQTQRSVQQLSELQLSSALRNAIKLAATLLVEMSTFPNCNKHIVLDKNEPELPNWLKVLCLVACFAQSDKELQVAAITTLFDLISLLRSQIEHTTSPGVTFVVMLPLLKFGHVNYLEQRTRVFQLVTSILWDYLGNPATDPSQIAALLHQLHSCLESGLVESVIGNRMYAQHLLQAQAQTGLGASSALRNFQLERVSDAQLLCPTASGMTERLRESQARSYKKFELLWHLGREKQMTRGFEKTLLKVLDTLALPHYMSERTFVTNWLQASLLRGDLARLTKPLYKILLSASSKRVGIVHMQQLYREAEQSVYDEDHQAPAFERDVYAISSEQGNVKYHHMEAANSGNGSGSLGGGKKKSPIRHLPKKIFGVTLSGGKSNKTSNFVSDKTPLATEALQDINTIGLIINPLENAHDFDDETDLEEPRIELVPNAGGKDAPQTPLEQKLASAMDESEQVQPQEPEAVSLHYDQDITDNSESSDFESDSEQRETSIEKEDSLTISSSVGAVGAAGGGGGGANDDVKRFVGDCERVTEALTQHERIKSRKTYRLTREMTPGESSLKDLDDTSVLTAADNEHAQPADEYFSEATAATARPQDKKLAKELRKRKKLLTSSEKKRLSCISKTSTDSNHSNPTEQLETEATHSEEEEPEAITESSTINVEDKRRNLSLETSKLQAPDWQKTLEKSKQNVEILRQNAAAAAAEEQLSIRSSTKSSSSLGIGLGSARHSTDTALLYHNHLLLYLAIYDTRQTLYALQTLRNIICCDKRTFLCLSITTSFTSGSLKQLLIRHRKSISGKGFAGSVSNSEYAHGYRGCMHLELLVTLLLFYARGYFQRESLDAQRQPPTLQDVINNRRIQLESIELLALICTELIEIVKGMGRGLACYIADLLARAKLQKVMLHCLNSSVCNYGRKPAANSSGSYAEQVLYFNDPQDDQLHADCFQLQLLRLLLSVIRLEHEVHQLRQDTPSHAAGEDASNTSGQASPTRLAEGAAANVKYLPNCLISQQPMFLAAVLGALQQERLRHLHRNWTDLVTSSLNCFSFGSLTNIVISVVHQLCNNLDRLARLSLPQQRHFPPDYVLSQLEALTILCHYCLLDNTQQTALSHLFNQAYPQTSVASQSSSTGQLLNSIVHSFLSANESTSTSSTAPRNPQLQAARNAVLSHLPRIMTSVAAIWDSELGQLRPVRQQLLEFLSPVSLHHGCNFLAAIAVTWQQRGCTSASSGSSSSLNVSGVVEQYQRNSTLQACPAQLSLVSLVSSIRVMPMDSFVQTLHQVVKSPPPIHRPPAQLSIEVSALELFYFYMKSAPAPQLADAWPSLLVLIRDGLNLTPPAQFALLMLLNEFVQHCPQMPFQDKKEVRELHDVTARLVESLSSVAGACLEQTTWLRRNLAVKEDTDGNAKDNSLGGGMQQYSLQAQSVLAGILSNLLDVAYGSQEKDKVVTIVTTLLYNITPYLKNHTARNVPFFYACSALLASLSGFQYTRKAWRKDMLDLLLDNAFFQMHISCLPYWRQIMDSLMTYDNTTFRELMTRVSLSQAGSLNIFASRDQEYELRAMLLKRLAFVIYCSEFDQHNKYMPDIQEQLANSLRLVPLGPSVQAAVFLCFRVLLLRMSPDHVTSLWPIIIAEMVQVFLQMEQELKSDSDERSQQSQRLLPGIDVSWSSSNSSASNGMNTQTPVQQWRSVQLEACKLLELGCVLPATKLPHFQMYRWAFVGTEFDVHEEVVPLPLPNGSVENLAALPSALYVPHVRRVARLMDMKYTSHSPLMQRPRNRHLMLGFQQLQSLQELYPFFSTLGINCPNSCNYADTEQDVANCLEEIEDVLAHDFLEKLPSITTPR